MGIWAPSTALLNTVTEFQSFSHNIQYYVESVTAGAIDPGTGLAGPDVVTQTYYPVTITQVNPRTTVATTNGNPATVSGLYRYCFNDTVIYRNFNNQIITLTGTETLGTWEQLDMNDCYQITEFTPDTTRSRSFSFTAEAKNGAVVLSTMTYNIVVSDQSWTPGMNALKDAVAIIRGRGN